VTTQALAFGERRADDDYFWLGTGARRHAQICPDLRSGFYRTALAGRRAAGPGAAGLWPREVTVQDFIPTERDTALRLGAHGRHLPARAGRVQANVAPKLLDPSFNRADTIVK
jgi:hypothetical protein